ncbi:MAG: radical SAM protein [Bacillota bacterium]
MAIFIDALVNIINSCDNACAFCFRAFRNNDIMDLDTYSLILSRLVNINIDSICLTGGEPLDHPYLNKLLKTSNIYGISCSIITTAYGEYRLSKLEAIAQYLSHINISVNSKMVQSIGKTDLKIENNYNLFKFLSASGVSYSVNFIYFSLDESEIESLLEIKEAFPGLDYDFSPLIIKPGELSNFLLSDNTYIKTLKRDFKMLQKVFNFNKKYISRFHRYCNEYGKEIMLKCQYDRLFITTTGEIRTCPYNSSEIYIHNIAPGELKRSIIFNIKGQYRNATECNNLCY